jgi:hypothetical protein
LPESGNASSVVVAVVSIVMSHQEGKRMNLWTAIAACFVILTGLLLAGCVSAPDEGDERPWQEAPRAGLLDADQL